MALSFPKKGMDLSRWPVGLGVGWLSHLKEIVLSRFSENHY